MARPLIHAPEAPADIEAATRWLTQPGSGPRVRRTLAAIRTDTRRLRLHPCRWPIGDHPGVRESPCTGGYRALYRVSPDTGRDDTPGDAWVFGPGQRRGAI